MEERHLSLSEAAEALDISERTAYRWVKSGKLKAFKPGRDYWIPESAIREVVEESEVHPKAPRRSSLEPSLFNGLEDERRLLDYRKCREALDHFCDYWEQALADDRLDRRARDEFEAGAKLITSLLVELWLAEKVELRVQRGEDPQTVDKADPWPLSLMEKSALWPAIHRWMVIGQRVDKIAKERFGEDAAGTAVADLREYARRKAG